MGGSLLTRRAISSLPKVKLPCPILPRPLAPTPSHFGVDLFVLTMRATFTHLAALIKEKKDVKEAFQATDDSRATVPKMQSSSQRAGSPRKFPLPSAVAAQRPKSH